MRKLFFSVIVLFTIQHLSAQKLILMNELKSRISFRQIMSKDSCVYRVDGYDQLVIDEKFKHYINIHSLSSESAWLDWLSWQVLPREIRPFIKKSDYGKLRKFPSLNMGKPLNCYRGLMLEFLLDGYGNIITVSFYVDKEIRDKITEKHLKKMYNAIMKHKMPSIAVEEILSLKENFLFPRRDKKLSLDSTCIECLVDIGEQIEYLEKLKDFDWQELSKKRKESTEELRKKGLILD